jgi:aspartate/tyrosine/aromatic aminotransferase
VAGRSNVHLYVQILFYGGIEENHKTTYIGLHSEQSFCKAVMTLVRVMAVLIMVIEQCRGFNTCGGSGGLHRDS